MYNVKHIFVSPNNVSPACSYRVFIILIARYIASLENWSILSRESIIDRQSVPDRIASGNMHMNKYYFRFIILFLFDFNFYLINIIIFIFLQIKSLRFNQI